MTVLLRAWALALALLWSFPGFGVIDLLFSWNPEWAVMVEAGWGLFVSLGLTLPLLVAVVRPSLARVALLHLLVASGTLVVTVAAGRETTAWWMLLSAAVSAGTLAALAHRESTTRSDRPAHTSPWPLAALAVVAIPPGLAYAWRMTTAGWDGPPADITNDVDHYVVQAALALAVPALALLAAWSPADRRLAGTSAALMAGYSGLVSWSFPGTLAGWSPALSAAAMAWATLMLVAAWWPAHDRVPVRRA